MMRAERATSSRNEISSTITRAAPRSFFLHLFGVIWASCSCIFISSQKSCLILAQHVIGVSQSDIRRQHDVLRIYLSLDPLQRDKNRHAYAAGVDARCVVWAGRRIGTDVIEILKRQVAYPVD